MPKKPMPKKKATTFGEDLVEGMKLVLAHQKGEAELAARALGLEVRTAPFVANTTGSVSDGNRALNQARAARLCGLHLGGGGLNPAVVESHNAGLTPTQDDIRAAGLVAPAARAMSESRMKSQPLLTRIRVAAVLLMALATLGTAHAAGGLRERPRARRLGDRPAVRALTGGAPARL